MNTSGRQEALLYGNHLWSKLEEVDTVEVTLPDWLCKPLSLKSLHVGGHSIFSATGVGWLSEFCFLSCHIPPVRTFMAFRWPVYYGCCCERGKAENLIVDCGSPLPYKASVDLFNALIVTRFACSAHRLVSSIKCTIRSSAAI